MRAGRGRRKLVQDLVNLEKEFDFYSEVLTKTTGGVLSSSEKILLSSTSRSVFQMRQLWPREAKSLAWGHTAGE